MPNTISLQTIAEAAGVTRTTVSLALRHHPRISMQTGERVRSLARSLGYRPNADLSRMMRGIRTRSPEAAPSRIALVHAGSATKEWIHALGTACQASGYQLEDMGGQALSGARLGQILHTRNIRALLLSSPAPNRILGQLNTRNLCVCVVSETPVGHHRIDPRLADPDWIAREAVELLDQLLQRHRYGVPAHPKVIQADQPSDCG